MNTELIVALCVIVIGTLLLFAVLWKQAEFTKKFQDELKKGQWVRVETDFDEFHGTISEIDGDMVEVYDGVDLINVNRCNIYPA